MFFANLSTLEVHISIYISMSLLSQNVPKLLLSDPRFFTWVAIILILIQYLQIIERRKWLNGVWLYLAKITFRPISFNDVQVMLVGVRVVPGRIVMLLQSKSKYVSDKIFVRNKLVIFKFLK